MLDALETRLADLLADALSGGAQPPVVARRRPGLPEAGSEVAAVLVRVLTAEASERFDDDALEVLRRPGEMGLRPVLRLAGEVEVEVAVAADLATDRRVAVMRALDRVLLALHAEAVRTGAAFLTGEDLGFALDAFRLRRLGGPEGDEPDVGRLRAIYGYAGRFWPVEAPAEGELIESVPTRVAVLPFGLPEGLTVRAGGGDLEIPLRVDLRAGSGAPAVLVARLGGASPPGSLVGSAAPELPDHVAYPVTDGACRIVYRPPDALDAAERARVELVLAHPGRRTVRLAELRVEVLP
jgi:hypothetical protein